MHSFGDPSAFIRFKPNSRVSLAPQHDDLESLTFFAMALLRYGFIPGEHSENSLFTAQVVKPLQDTVRDRGA